MKIKMTLVAMLAVLAASVLAAPRPAAVDFSGTWLGKTTLPDGTVDEFNLVLKKEKDSYTGTIADSLQAIAPATPIQSVEVEGGVISFTFPWPDGAMIYCKLTLAGEKMTGDWTHPAGTMGALIFEKKK
jgi:hypothetical protein